MEDRFIHCEIVERRINMQNETKKELHTQMWKIENPKDFTAHDREVLEKAAAIIRAGGLVGISDGNGVRIGGECAG